MFKKISLKVKIFGVITIIIAALLISSIWSIYNFLGLKKSINEIMQANYQSIVAAQNMAIAIERQDSAELGYMFESSDILINDFRINEEEFLKWLSRAEDNITEEGEREVLSDINNYYVDYLNKFSKLIQFTSVSDSQSLREYYYNEILPLFEEVKSSCRDLITLNQNAMLDLKKKAESRAITATYSTLAVSLSAMLFGFFITLYLINRIINPIRILVKKIKKISEGDYSQRLSISGDYETVELANEFNSMAEKLNNYKLMNIDKITKEKQKAEAIVESISDGVIVTDDENKIILLNKATERILNIREIDTLDKHFLEVINMKEVFKIIERVQDKPDSDESKKFTEISIREDKDIKYYRINVTPIKGESKKNIGVVTLLQDITKLKEIDNMKSDFISKVSHEFRTPLTSITMATGLMLDEIPGKINKKQKELLNAMSEDSKRLVNLVSELLDLSKIESGIVKMDIQPQDIYKIVKSSVKQFELQLKSMKINLKIEKRKNLPSVMADFNKIVWVMTNLIGNAIKYVPTDGSGLIEIKFKKTPVKLSISVSDNGKGISESYQKIIFNKFFQVKDDRQRSGVGLGLSISKEILNAHGGDIWVKSELNKGSTFYFTLKIAKK
ncbi:hypothetical protein A2V94_05895 [Candidatus Atribacteria bacterium RBG_16_35_8]|nr:MAG: hypothetical protein A2V94_05895 [Candidatus Atribacteria bacterium RBG_16_35_8]